MKEEIMEKDEIGEERQGGDQVEKVEMGQKIKEEVVEQ